MEYDAILRRVIKNRNKENAGFVIQTKNNQIIQLTKDEIREELKHLQYLSSTIAGLTLTSDNRVIVNKKQLKEVDKNSLVEITLDNLMYSRKETERYLGDWLAANKYKEYPANFTQIQVLNSGVVLLNVKINEQIKETENIYQIYFDKFYKLIPSSYQSREIFVEEKNIAGKAYPKHSFARRGSKGDTKRWRLEEITYYLGLIADGQNGYNINIIADEEMRFTARQIVGLKRIIGTN